MAKQQAKDEMEKERVYPIPDNFADGTGVFGGIFPMRNFIEGVIFAIPMLLLSLAISIKLKLGISSSVPVIVFMVSPPLIIGCIGINGDSVTEFLAYFIRFRQKRRLDRYNPRVKLEFTGDINLGQNEVPIDKIKRMLVNLSRKDKQSGSESDKYYDVLDNIAFEDDVALQKKLAARAARSKLGK